MDITEQEFEIREKIGELIAGQSTRFVAILGIKFLFNAILIDVPKRDKAGINHMIDIFTAKLRQICKEEILDVVTVQRHGFGLV